MNGITIIYRKKAEYYDRPGIYLRQKAHVSEELRYLMGS